MADEPQDEPQEPQEPTEPQDEPQEPASDPQEPQDEPDTFPRSYVEELREENAKLRVKAKDRDDLAARLHAALVGQTGRLADPTDLAYDEAHLTDQEALDAAIEDLLARKPHLASRHPQGDIGQGAAQSGSDFDLAGVLRQRT